MFNNFFRELKKSSDYRKLGSIETSFLLDHITLFTVVLNNAANVTPAHARKFRGQDIRVRYAVLQTSV